MGDRTTKTKGTEMQTLHIHIEFTQPILGTGNPDPEIHERFIASKAPDAKSLKEEVAAVGIDEVTERGTTVFPKTQDGHPMMWDYQFKGFLKEACATMKGVDGSESKGFPYQYKSTIDRFVFPRPRHWELVVPDGEPMRIMQRPLRAETMQGPRVALAASEMLPAGTTCDFDVVLMSKRVGVTKSKQGVDLLKCLVEWVSYGQLLGMGQWRSGGWGTFHATVTDAQTGEVLFDNV